jgi:hypothetical protein
MIDRTAAVPRPLRRILLACACAAATLAVAPAAALADTATSSNWAGYAVHRNGVRFTRVTGAWKQPNATCTRGNPTFSAMWIGLGGFSLTSNALEQIGTEVDCTSSGRVSSTAWYELVPAPSRNINLRVRPGDSMSASVTVVGRRVTVSLVNQTMHTSYQHTFTTSSIDVTSAEWIVEAPSECYSNNSCQTLPLANFGMAGFTQARAKTVSGRTGSISSSAWGATKIVLQPSGRRFVTNGGGTMGAANPSGLTAGGSAFKVAFAPVSANGNAQHAARTASLSALGRLVHPAR